MHVLPFGETPQTRHVRGSNMTFIGVAKDRMPGRAMSISALDNLVKGASGQAIQNMNLVLGCRRPWGSIRSRCFPKSVQVSFRGAGLPPGPGIQIQSPVGLSIPGPAPALVSPPRNDEGGPGKCSTSTTSRRRSSPIICSRAMPCCARRSSAKAPNGRKRAQRARQTLGKPETVQLGSTPTKIHRSCARSTATATASTRWSSIRPGTNRWRSRCAPASIRAPGQIQAGAHVARAAGTYMLGPGRKRGPCPLAMTYGSVPTLRLCRTSRQNGCPRLRPRL